MLGVGVKGRGVKGSVSGLGKGSWGVLRCFGEGKGIMVVGGEGIVCWGEIGARNSWRLGKGCHGPGEGNCWRAVERVFRVEWRKVSGEGDEGVGGRLKVMGMSCLPVASSKG